MLQLALRFGYYKKVPAVLRLQKSYNRIHVQHSNKCNNPPNSDFQVFFPQPACSQSVLCTPHTLVIVGLLISDALLALFFPPFCLQKEKHIAVVLK